MSYPHYTNEKKRDRNPNVFDPRVHVLYTSHKRGFQSHLIKSGSCGQVGTSAKGKRTWKIKPKIYKSHNNTEDSIGKNADCRKFPFIICVSTKNIKGLNTIYILS